MKLYSKTAQMEKVFKTSAVLSNAALVGLELFRLWRNRRTDTLTDRSV